MNHPYRAPPIPIAFIWRRAHSFTGLWLVIFLIEHLLTNSQAALLIGNDGKGFIHTVNALKDLPYLPIIEIFLLGVPFLVHGLWGIQYLMSGKMNSFSSNGSSPTLPQYPRNHAYSWQRITSWILLVGIIAHVVHMRFMEYPVSAKIENQQFYMVRLKEDEGIYTLSKRLGFTLYNPQQIKIEKLRILLQTSVNSPKDSQQELIITQKANEERHWLEQLEKLQIHEKQLVAVSPSFGIAELLMVRDTFKNPYMIFLYSGLVLAACFHAFNGLWTFMISWGLTLTFRSQQLMRSFATSLMILISFLGLAAIWGTYWINLRH